MDSLKKAICDLAFRGVEDGISIPGFEDTVYYDTMQLSPTQMQVIVRRGSQSAARRFTIQVRENLY